jgi:DNA-directed RNA polymerase subunit RPC12/RpoP
MKIEGTCNTCGRTFLLSQIGPQSEAPGRCPFCGAHFARHYTTLLPETVEEAEAAAEHFVAAVNKLQSLQTGFRIDFEGLLKMLQEQVRSGEGNTPSVQV